MSTIKTPAQQHGILGLREWLRTEFQNFTDIGADLDLRVYIAPDVRFDLRIVGVDRILTGYSLDGCVGDIDRRIGSEVAIQLFAILLIEKLSR